MVQKQACRIREEDPLVRAINNPLIQGSFDTGVAAGLGGHTLVDYAIGVIEGVLRSLPEGSARLTVEDLRHEIACDSLYAAHFLTGDGCGIPPEPKNPGYKACLTH